MSNIPKNIGKPNKDVPLLFKHFQNFSNEVNNSEGNILEENNDSFFVYN